MNGVKIMIQLLLWVLLCSHAQALSLVTWTVADWMEKMDRIVIGTVEVKGGQSIITVETVLKGASVPKVITTKMKPYEDDSQAQDSNRKVLWMEANPGKYKSNSPYAFTYIKEGSPRWLLYHGFIDPAPLVRDKVFECDINALRVLGYLFNPLKVSSSDAPMVAERLMDYSWVAESLPWGYAGVLDMKCSLVPGNSELMQVDSMSSDDESAIMIRDTVEKLPLDYMRSKVPTKFSLRIDTRKVESIGSVSYEEVAQHLRHHMNMSLADFQRIDHRFKGRKYSYEENSDFHNIVHVSVNSLKRMQDSVSVPDVIMLAVQSDADELQTVFDFLKSARDPRSVKPMCELIEKYAPMYPEKHGLSNGAVEVLGKIGDPVAVPYLELGVRHDVQFAYFSLAQMGGVESMGVIINSTKDRRFDAHAHAPLFWMVMRSNLKVETWMELHQHSDGSRDDELRAKWSKWWLANKDEMEFVRTFDEASRGWEPQWQIDEREAKMGGKNHAWKYVMGVGIATLLFLVYRLQRRRALTGKLMVHS